jgi:transcriptional regulator with XRE-family HTH domain
VAKPVVPDPIGQNLGTRIGSSIKSTRRAIGWTEREFATRLGTNQGAVQRLEAGRQRHLDVPLATAALDLLGIRLTIDANPVGLPGRREQRDLVHARCCGYVARQLKKRGWEVLTEVEIGEGRFRGWIDLLAYRPSDGSLLVIEVKTEIDDIGRILRSLGWYVRSSRDAAQAVGWRPRIIVPILLALATVETDTRLAANSDVVRNDLSGGAGDLAAWIENPTAATPKPTIALIDPVTRRRAWLWRTRSDGRRSPAPYRDYRDAAGGLSGR